MPATGLPASAPTLDCDREPWVGHFPGLGGFEVFADGKVRILAEHPDAEPVLRHGWAQNLAWLRTGGQLSAAITLVAPGLDGALLIHGEFHDFPPILHHLLQHQWRLLSDLPARLTWDGGTLVAHPGNGHLIMSARQAGDLPATPLSDDTDAVLVDIDWHDAPVPVRAVALAPGRTQQNAPLVELTGYERFEPATKLFLPGSLSGLERPTSQTMAEHLELSRLPWCRVRPTAGGEHLSALLEWWAAL